MYLEIFLADFVVFRGFCGISRDFAEKPEFRGSATAQNIRSPAHGSYLNFSQWVMPSGNSNLSLISDLMFLVNKRLQSRRSQILSRLWLESNTQGNEDPGFALGAAITSRVWDGYVEMVVQSPQGEVKILPSNNHCVFYVKY